MSILRSDYRVKIVDDAIMKIITVNLTVIENGATLQCSDHNIACRSVERRSNIRTLNGQLNLVYYFISFMGVLQVFSMK